MDILLYLLRENNDFKEEFKDLIAENFATTYLH